MEVVVTFEGGDPDKPMVVGAVPNGTHPVPFRLPEQKSWSGIRTSSYPGGRGFNEFSFDDLAGHEKVYLHAQRDYTERILRDRAAHVDGNESLIVGRDQDASIGGTRRSIVAGADRLEVHQNVERHVRGGLKATVGRAAEVSIDTGLSLSIGGTYAVQVGGGGHAASELYVEGTHSIGAKERIVLRAEGEIVLACGKASIELSPDKLVIKAPTIEIEAEETLDCSSKKGPSVTLGDKAEVLTKSFSLFTEGAALELDKDAKMKGAAIKLGYDPQKPTRDAKDDKPETRPLAAKLSDYFLTPYRNKKYHVLAEGVRIEGETDGEGNVRCDVPKTARAAQIRLWLSDYPQGPRREYTVEFDEVKPSTSIEGAKTRLKNLGYYHGRVDGVVDEELATAIAGFQGDHKDSHGLDVNGEAEAPTLAAIADVHGS
jgi:type VI secretion system secreted protein VgrG